MDNPIKTGFFFGLGFSLAVLIFEIVMSFIGLGLSMMPM